MAKARFKFAVGSKLLSWRRVDFHRRKKPVVEVVEKGGGALQSF
jgi:hypothetical protein